MPLHRRPFIGPLAGFSAADATMQRRTVSQITSISRPLPLLSATSPTALTSASVPSTLTTAQPPPVSTVIITSTVAASPVSTPATTTTNLSPVPPNPVVPTAVYTTATVVTEVLTTAPTPSTSLGLTVITGIKDGETVSPILTDIASLSDSVYDPPQSSGSSSSRSSSARASASVIPSSSPSVHKVSKSEIGKYVGYAIGAVFILTLVSSFISAWRKHRKFVKKRPRGSMFVGAGGANSSLRRSISQALMRSVSNRSFDAYALPASNPPPTNPAPAFLRPNSHTHSDVLNRARGFSLSAVQQVPQLPLTPSYPSPKYPVSRCEDPFAHPADPPRENSHYAHGPSAWDNSSRTIWK